MHVQALVAGRLTPQVEATAEIEALRTANLRAEAPGRVVALEFDRGEVVEAGQILLRLDVGRTAVALEAASASIAQAEARLSQVIRERELAERLVQNGTAAPRTLDDARDAERLASTAVDAARAQMGVTRRGLTEAVVRAPFRGTIAERVVEVGEFLAPGAPIAMLVDTSRLKARVLLDPREAIDIPLGSPARLRVHARPDETFEARVVRVGDVVDPRTRRLPVELEVDDPGGRLRPGLVGRFEVQTGPPREAISVESDAVFERFGQQHVYVVVDGTARRRTVELGVVRDGRVEVRSGLSIGDRVVVAGVERVVDEQPVRVVEGLAAGDRGERPPP